MSNSLNIIADGTPCETNYSKFEEGIERIPREYKEFSSSSLAARYVEKARQISDILELAKKKYIGDMSDAVEKRASKTFGHLTTEEDFDKLKI